MPAKGSAGQGFGSRPQPLFLFYAQNQPNLLVVKPERKVHWSEGDRRELTEAARWSSRPVSDARGMVGAEQGAGEGVAMAGRGGAPWWACR